MKTTMRDSNIILNILITGKINIMLFGDLIMFHMICKIGNLQVVLTESLLQGRWDILWLLFRESPLKKVFKLLDLSFHIAHLMQKSVNEELNVWIFTGRNGTIL